jgi:hypothetical protein
MKNEKIIEHITEIKNDVKWIKKALDGNGSKGLIEQVRCNTNWRYYMIGGIAVVNTIILVILK